MQDTKETPEKTENLKQCKEILQTYMLRNNKRKIDFSPTSKSLIRESIKTFFKYCQEAEQTSQTFLPS